MSYEQRPASADFPKFYHRYVEEAEGTDLLQALRISEERMRNALLHFRPDQEDHRYAPGKWSVKEVVQHVIDGERIFAYRALRFARNDDTGLPGFEENDYVPASLCERRTIKDLLREYSAVRGATTLLFESLPPDALDRSGMANERPITVRALGWVIAGHSNHHVNILLDRYLPTAGIGL